VSDEDERRREELQRQIAAEEAAQQQREAELEAERLEAAEEARQQAMAQQTATAAIEAVTLAAASVAASPTSPPVPTAIPTAAPTPRPTAIVQADPVVEENSFVDPTDVDSPPVVLKKSPVVWSRAAIHSRRQGVVVLQVTVNADGLVDDVKILRSDHEGFGIPQAVMDAVKKYHFKPGSKNGVLVKTYFSVAARYDFTGR